MYSVRGTTLVFHDFPRPPMHFMFQFVMAFWGRNKVCTVSSTRIRVHIYIYIYHIKPKQNLRGGSRSIQSGISLAVFQRSAHDLRLMAQGCGFREP